MGFRVEQIPNGFLEKAYKLGKRLKNWKRDRSILIVGHRDGDGISATSVLLQSLQGLGFKKISTEILLSPDPEKIETLLTENNYEYVITGDIGAGFEELFKESVLDFIIADHHPNESGVYGSHQLNPCEFQMNDESDCSGSTTAAMIVINAFSQDFWHTDRGKVILCYAVAGAISDFQMKNGPISVNKYITDLAVNVGALSMQKDISLFGRGMYPIFIALNRSGLPGLEDSNICSGIIRGLFELKENEMWKRLIDLTMEEKAKLNTALTQHFLMDKNLNAYTSKLIKSVVGYVYDLLGLKGWDCTLIDAGQNTPDARYTLDAREILHRVNYVCRRGKADFALKLLNNKNIDPDLWQTIEFHHKIGDREVAMALNLYESGKIPVEIWDERIIMADFTGIIYYDEVGVVAGVIMKKNPEIEIMLSYCDIEDNIVKLSVRGREDIWRYVEKETGKLGDAKRVYQAIRRKYPNKIMQFGGHRFACSGYLARQIVSQFYKEMVKYYNTLQPLSSEETPTAKRPMDTEPNKREIAKSKTKRGPGQRNLDQFT